MFFLFFTLSFTFLDDFTKVFSLLFYLIAYVFFIELMTVRASFLAFITERSLKALFGN